MHKKNIILVADVDFSRNTGDVARIMAVLPEIKKYGCNISVLAPKPSKNETMINLEGVKTAYIYNDFRYGTVSGLIKRTLALFKKAKELRNGETIFLIETSPLGGKLSLLGLSDYILDVHGIFYDELNYINLPKYIPRKIYKTFMYIIEKKALEKASKVIVVSDTMADFISNEWNISEDKIAVVPNGYFSTQINEIEETRVIETEGMIVFVGTLYKWGNIEKILRVAHILRNENFMFYIIGGCDDKKYLQELQELAFKLKLNNINFTGSLPLRNAYEMIAKSQISIFPFFESISTEVACPIKLLEYMAFGKAMVIDEISDISKLLKENNAALVCNPSNDNEFAENIRVLMNNPQLRKRIGENAKLLSKDYSWDIQGKKLAECLVDFMK